MVRIGAETAAEQEVWPELKQQNTLAIPRAVLVSIKFYFCLLCIMCIGQQNHTFFSIFIWGLPPPSHLHKSEDKKVRMSLLKCCVMSCHVMLFHIMSCHLCPAISYHVLSYHVISCLINNYSFFNNLCDTNVASHCHMTAFHITLQPRLWLNTHFQQCMHSHQSGQL